MVAGPIITLTTDFGLRDVFVGVMKGVMLGICPEALLVDLTHEVAAQDVVEGALALEAAWRFFPPGTIHLAAIDPGVGSARRALALAAGGHYFVGPDNGLFSSVLADAPWSAVSIEAPAYRLPAVSQTFHGRDVFAPAAAHLASGVALARLGPAVSDPVRLALPGWRMEGGVLIGEVIGADRFGNLLTSVPADQVADLAARGAVAVELSGRNLGPPVACYADGADGVPTPVIGSSGRLEVFVRGGNAGALLRAPRGLLVTLRTIPR
jgi:S-adenosyl-L-methionine hydrolase (adenosine-forming)